MTELSPTTDTTLARVGDADRDAACDQLSAHYAAGRISAEELDQRLEAAWSARTRRDLYVLLRDLTPAAAARPRVTTPRPRAESDPRPPSMSAATALVLLLLAGCLASAAVILVMLTLGTPAVGLAAALVGLAGGVAGACLVWLVQRGHR